MVLSEEVVFHCFSKPILGTSGERVPKIVGTEVQRPIVRTVGWMMQRPVPLECGEGKGRLIVIVDKDVRKHDQLLGV